MTGAPFGQQSDLSLIWAFANPRAPRMNDRCSQDRHKRASGLAAEPALSRAIQDRLGRELRDMYAEIQRDTVTGRLADLVRQLEHKDLTLRGRRRPPRDAASQGPPLARQASQRRTQHMARRPHQRRRGARSFSAPAPASVPPSALPRMIADQAVKGTVGLGAPDGGGWPGVSRRRPGEVQPGRGGSGQQYVFADVARHL